MGGIVLGLFDPLFRFLLCKAPPVKYSEEDRSMVFCEETPKTLIGTPSTHTEYVFTSFCEGADEEVVPLARELVKRLCADHAIATEIRLRQEGEKIDGNLAYRFPARCYRFLQTVHPERSICKCDDSRIFVLTQGFDPEPYTLWKEFGISDDCWILYHIFPDSLPPKNAEQAAQAVDCGQYDLRLALHEFGPRSLHVALNNETVTFDSIQKIIKTVCRENHVPFHDQAPQRLDRPINTVKLYLGDYYQDYGEQYSGEKHLICVMPYHEDGDPSFGNLVRSLGAELLSEFPFIVEQLFGGQVQCSQRKGLFRKSYLEPVDLLQEAYISEYQSQGGQVHCREKNDLTALSEFDGPKLLPLIPTGSLASAAYCGYGAREMPPGWAAGRPEFREEAQYELCLVCGEYHDHLLIETSGDLQHYIGKIKERCRQEGRMLILETWSDGTEQGRLQEQQLL